VVDLELRVLHPVQQHIHSREVVGGDVLLLSVDLAIPCGPCACERSAVASQSRRQSHHAAEALPLAGLRLLAVECDDRRENVGNPLRRVELTGLLARAGCELADQVFVGVTQCVAIRRELREALG